jgi:hypothetical protein
MIEGFGPDGRPRDLGALNCEVGALNLDFATLEP